MHRRNGRRWEQDAEELTPAQYPFPPPPGFTVRTHADCGQHCPCVARTLAQVRGIQEQAAASRDQGRRVVAAYRLEQKAMEDDLQAAYLKGYEARRAEEPRERLTQWLVAGLSVLAILAVCWQALQTS